MVPGPLSLNLIQNTRQHENLLKSHTPPISRSWRPPVSTQALSTPTSIKFQISRTIYVVCTSISSYCKPCQISLGFPLHFILSHNVCCHFCLTLGHSQVAIDNQSQQQQSLYCVGKIHNKQQSIVSQLLYYFHLRWTCLMIGVGTCGVLRCLQHHHRN